MGTQHGEGRTSMFSRLQNMIHYLVGDVHDIVGDVHDIVGDVHDDVIEVFDLYDDEDKAFNVHHSTCRLWKALWHDLTASLPGGGIFLSH